MSAIKAQIMHLNMCIPYLFNKHSLALIIYDRTSEQKLETSAVDSTKESKPLLREAALLPPTGTGTQVSPNKGIMRCKDEGK